MSSPALRCAPPLLRGLRSKLPSASRRLLTPPSLLLQPPRVRFFFVCSAALSSSRGSARRRGERAFGAAAEAAEEDSNCSSRNGGDKGGSYFFAEEDVSWKSLGISEGVARALSNASINRPSLVQAACIPQILTGKDVIIAAETGSGKTHGYLVPLFERLCAKSDACKTGGSEEVSERHKISLILCPNVMLCEQVTQMANGLVDDSGQPLLKAVAVCGRRGWPVTQPDILVSTPAALLNYLFDFDPEKKRRPQFLRDVKCVVFDEADMLLCGSFQNQIIRLINMLRFEEKILSKMESSTQHNITDKVDMEDHYSEMLVNEDHEEEESNDLDDLEDTETEEAEVAATRFKDWRRVRKVYKRSKQYIFVAATLPQSGKKTAGGMLKRMFPDSIWISGDFLHRHNPRLEQRWIEVTPDTQVDALIDAVKYGFRCNPQDCDNDDASRVMVFTNTVEAAQSVAQILERVGLQCILYHRASSLEERTNNLNSFRDKGGILVCTDAAARGLDVPKISHVIQAEFATSVVDFLHRVGRTARAGETGVVTSLYTKSNRDLVAAVRQAETLDQPVEKAFSRKRSFRNKLKKIGRSEMAQPKGIKITAELSGQQIS